MIRPGDPRSAPAIDEGSVTWIMLATPQTVGGRGSAALLGTVDVPDAGFHLSYEAGASTLNQGGDVTFQLHFTTGDGAHFGPITSLAVPPIWGADGHVWLLADRVEKLRADGFNVMLTLPIDGSVLSPVKMELGDASGRHATLMLPVGGPVGAVLKAAAQKVRRAGG